jgi:hypothetical protein
MERIFLRRAAPGQTPASENRPVRPASRYNPHQRWRLARQAAIKVLPEERTMRLRRWIHWVVLALPFGLPGVAIAQVDDAPSLAGVNDIHAHATR